MTNVKFSRNEFEKQVKITKEIEEKISLFGTPLEKIDKEEIEIEIFPNRPDLISMQGYLRSFKAFLGKETGLKKYTLQKPQPNYTVKIEPSVKEVRPFIACAIVKNLSFDNEKIKEIIDLQEKLHLTVGRNRKKVAIGIYPLGKIKLPIKYKALPPEKIKFRPLESDREMTAIQILNRHPAGKKYAALLEDKDKFPIFLDSDNKILSMPPLINSHETGKITKEANGVFIECSGFDFEILNKTLNIIVTTLSDMGGKVYQMNLDYGTKRITTPNLTTEKMKISLENINKLLGLSLSETDLSRLLPKMGHDYSNRTVTIPAWRTDILHEVDIAEDVAIAYGYNNLKPEIPNITTTAQESQESTFRTKLSELLVGLGLIEISTYHLIKQHEIKLAKLKNAIEVEDSKTDYKALRPNLLIPTLRILSENKDRDYPQKIFEIGTTFERDATQETGIKETETLIIANSPANFTVMKQILNYLSESLNLDLQLKETTHQNLIEGRTASIELDNKTIGHMGELHPETLRNWLIRMPVSIIEISLDEIFSTLQ